MNRVPRIMAVHDLSGIGRSSLSAVISVLSTLGVQTCAMPTALLSTDTSQFRDFSFLSLTAKNAESHCRLFANDAPRIKSGNTIFD